jgi:uncharacterized membrane protein YdjX (TVP38/TMEM64 family)
MRLQDRISDFLTSLDSTGGRVIWVAFALFTIAGIVLTAGIFFIDLDQGALATFLRGLRGQWWAPAVVTGTFIVLAFIGAPQVLLIAATVSVFGPAEGMILSWIATLTSASVGYSLGRVAGAPAVRKLLGGRGGRALAFIGDNGFIASLLIRLVPSGPFIVVNMALGAARVAAMHFIGGTGIGIWPKIALVAFGAHGLGEVLRGENLSALMFFVVAGIVWVLIAFVVRPLVRDRDAAKQLAASDDLE